MNTSPDRALFDSPLLPRRERGAPTASPAVTAAVLSTFRLSPFRPVHVVELNVGRLLRLRLLASRRHIAYASLRGEPSVEILSPGLRSSIQRAVADAVADAEAGCRR